MKWGVDMWAKPLTSHHLRVANLACLLWLPQEVSICPHGLQGDLDKKTNYLGVQETINPTL